MTRKPSAKAKKFYELHKQGWSNQQIADHCDYNINGVRGRISEARAWVNAQDPPDSTQVETRAKTIQFPEKPPTVKPLPKVRQAVKPTVIRTLTMQHNTADTFWRRYEDLKRHKRWLTIFFPFDKHFPFHDPDAIALDYKIMADIGADIIIKGSDEFDFPKESRHEPDYELMMNPEFDDCFERIETLYRDDTDAMCEVAPDALKPFIFGNHDLRFPEMALASNAPKTLVRLFTDLIKHNGQVFYLGNTQEILLDRLYIQHKGATGVNAARSMLVQDHTVHRVAGHTHRPQNHTHKGIALTTQAMIVGCRCDLTPFYATRHGERHTQWSQSLGMAVLDTQTDACQLTNIHYHRDDTDVYAMLGSTRYSVPMTFAGVL